MATRFNNAESTWQHEVVGNLAVAPQRKIQPERQIPLPVIDPERIREERRRQQEEQELLDQQMLFEAASRRRHDSSVKGKIAFIGSTIVIAVLAIVVVAYSIVTNLTFNTTKLNGQIAELGRQNAILSEALESNVGLLPSARESMAKYGLVAPNGQQIVNLVLPEQDKVLLPGGQTTLLKTSVNQKQEAAFDDFFVNLQQQVSGNGKTRR